MEQCPSQKAYSNQLKLTTDNLCLASNLSIPGEQQKTEWAPNIVIKYYYLPPLLMSFLSFQCSTLAVPPICKGWKLVHSPWAETDGLGSVGLG